MVESLASSYGTVEYRQTVLVQVATDEGVVGWGECVALNEPLYSGDWSRGEYELLKDIFVPYLLKIGEITAETVADAFRPFKQHNNAKAAIELAVLDAQLRTAGISIAEYFGSTVDSVECAVVVGLMEGDALVRSIQGHLDRGYRQMKLKIAPGKDIERIDLIRREFPKLEIRVDANGSYDWDNADHRRLLKELNQRNITLLEQPFVPDRARPFIELKRETDIPIALDESIVSWDRAVNAIEMDLCDVMLLKPGMLGGYLTAKKLQEYCIDRGIPTLLGGMLETAIARSANIALASGSDNTHYPAEVSPDGRWWVDRLNVEPLDMVDGRVPVPTGPGLGLELDFGVMERQTRHVHLARAGI